MVGEKKLTPEEEVQAAKERLRAAMQQVSSDVQNSADLLQERFLDTVQGVQERIQETTDHLEQKVDKAVRKPLDAVRKRPLEAVGAALLAGLIVGLVRPSAADKSKGKAQPNQTQADQSSPNEPPKSAVSGLASGLLAGGLGKMVLDVVREEYLTPENIRYWMGRLIGKSPKEEAWVKDSKESSPSSHLS